MREATDSLHTKPLATTLESSAGAKESTTNLRFFFQKTAIRKNLEEMEPPVGMRYEEGQLEPDRSQARHPSLRDLQLREFTRR